MMEFVQMIWTLDSNHWKQLFKKYGNWKLSGVCKCNNELCLHKKYHWNAISTIKRAI